MARTPPWDSLLDGRFQARHPLRTLAALFAEQRLNVALAILFYVIKQAPMWALPLATAKIIDAITPPQAPDAWHTVGWVVAGYAALLLQNVLTHTIFVRFFSRALRHVQFLLRSAIIERLQQLSLAFYDEQQSGALQAKILRDVDAIDGLCRQLVHAGLNAVLVITAAVTITLATQPVVTLYFLVTVPAGLGLLRLFHRQFQKHHSAFRQETEGMAARVSEMLTMLPVTRAHGLETEEGRGVRHTLHRLRKRGRRLDQLTELFAACSWVTFNLFLLACLAFSAWLVLHGRITVGEAVMYHSYFGMLVGAVGQILGVFPTMTQGAEAIRSIGEVLESPEVEVNEGKSPLPAPLRGEVRFEGVCYQYPKGREVALEGIQLTISPGSTVAIVGESGAGKSTLANLAIGFRKPTAGIVRVDGWDLTTIDLRTYRQQVGVVPQTTLLFSGTVRDNLTYGLGGWDDAQLWEILAQANLADFVRSLPQGLATSLGERGARLSGGQRQRLAIARALVRDPRLIILDEATSALDTESERLVQEAIERLTAGRTTLIIAHRFSTIRHAGRILVMEKGRVVEDGDRASLLARQGVFHRLARLQA